MALNLGAANLKMAEANLNVAGANLNLASANLKMAEANLKMAAANLNVAGANLKMAAAILNMAEAMKCEKTLEMRFLVKKGHFEDFKMRAVVAITYAHPSNYLRGSHRTVKIKASASNDIL